MDGLQSIYAILKVIKRVKRFWAKHNTNVEVLVAKNPKNAEKLSDKPSNIEKRLGRLEKRIANNENFARTFAACVSSQVAAVDAISDVVRRSLKNDASTQQEIAAAIRLYDKHKFRRWCSGVTKVVLWFASIIAAAITGALIYWLFSGQ